MLRWRVALESIARLVVPLLEGGEVVDEGSGTLGKFCKRGRKRSGWWRWLLVMGEGWERVVSIPRR